jgi:hypothetical protein
MGRHKQPILLTPLQREKYRTAFLNSASRNFPEKFVLLHDDVFAGCFTADQWADLFGLKGTWVNEWANDTIKCWTEAPQMRPHWPRPLDYKRFEFSISVVIVDADWDCFKKGMHDQLELELESFQSKNVPKVELPSDVPLMIDCAVWHFIGGYNAARIAELLPGLPQRTKVWKWLQDACELLDLPARKDLPRRDSKSLLR